MNRQKFASSAFWKMAETISSKGISLVISIILARILLPEDYGIVTLTTVFINLSIIFVQSGITTALVRKDKVDGIDYDNGFLIGFFIALLGYALSFLGSPLIAQYYNEPLLIPILRVQMLSLFLVAFGNINNVIITREFRFQELCLAGILSNLIGGIVGISLAYLGFGVWALVLYTLLRDGISCIIVLIRVKWIPHFSFDASRMKSLLGFSVWVLGASLLDFAGNNFSSLILGKEYSMTELGLYSKGNQIPEMICLYTFGAISSVLLPTFSLFQSDNTKLKELCRHMVKMTSYIIFPMMVGLGSISIRLVPFLYTAKWNSSIPIFIMACVYYGVNPLRTINNQLLYALGDSKANIQIEIIRSSLLIFGTVICVFVLKTSIYGIACIAAFVAVINVVVTLLFVRKYIDYKFSEWFSDLFPSIGLCFCLFLSVFMIGFLPVNDTLLMFVQIFIGVGVYIAMSIITKNSSFFEVKSILIERITMRKNKQIKGDL